MSQARYQFIQRSAGIGLLAFISPVTGFLVEVCLARLVGVSPGVDAYRATSIVLNLGNQIFFGAVTIQVLVPILCESNLRFRYRESRRTALLFGAALSCMLLPAIYLVSMHTDLILGLLAPGLGAHARDDATLQLRLFVLALAPLLWSGVLAAYLQSRSIFWITTLSQSFNNIVVIVLLLATRRVNFSLGLGNILGFAAMLGAHAALARRNPEAMADSESWGESFARVKQALRLAVPPMLALVPPLISGAVLVRALSRGPAGTLAECGYAGRPLLAVALLPVAVNTMLLPKLAESRILDSSRFTATVARTIKINLLLTLPLMAVLFALRHPFIELLFGSKALSDAALNRITTFFAVFLIGSPAAALGGSLSQVGASLQDTRAASSATLVGTTVTVICVALLRGRGAPLAIVSVIVIANWGTCAWAAGYLTFVHRVNPWRGLARQAFDICAIAAIAGLIACLVHASILERIGTSPFATLLNGFTSVAIAFVVGCAAGLWLGIDEMHDASAFIKWQVDRLLAPAPRT